MEPNPSNRILLGDPFIARSIPDSLFTNQLTGGVHCSLDLGPV